MPIYGLEIKATLENIQKLYAPINMFWRIRFKCLSCSELGKNQLEFSALDECKAGKAKFNVASRCQFCGRLRSLDIVQKSENPYVFEDSGSFKMIIQFDCRGMEPVEYTPGDGWVAEAADSGEVFNNIDLMEKEWVEYDSNLQRPVGIYGLEYKFTK
ncbi:CXXC motif containing zinc binding protein [Hetaerina americana]|uniref:CXXC motif containing zinc binding protein n=1 Tax=Hetaerina americana TaxID=62018 RepID=UPI003A7F2606